MPRATVRAMELLLLALTGVLASALNVVAGGGSFLTLPLLILLGLPPGEANATNRVGVLLQNLGGVAGFHRHGVLDWRVGRAAALPGMAGALLGAWLALAIPDAQFKRLLALLMLGVTAWSLLAPHRRKAAGRLGGASAALAHLLIGVYAGFIQAGVGFMILAVTTLQGLDLVRGNAVKVLLVLLQTAVALVVFAGHGKVQWLPGLVLGLGCLTGGLLGVRLAVLKGQAWLERVVAVAIVLLALRLLLLP